MNKDRMLVQSILNEKKIRRTERAMKLILIGVFVTVWSFIDHGRLIDLVFSLAK